MDQHPRGWRGAAGVVAALSMLTGCPGTPANDGGAGTGGGAGGGGSGAQPVEVGLDARPANATCLAGPAPVSTTAIELQDAFPGLSFAYPVGLFQAPVDPSDPSARQPWFVLEQGGLVRRFPDDPDAQPGAVTTFLDLRARVSFAGNNDERGLLGMAFHPDFHANRQLFFSYTWDDGGGLDSYLSRYEAAPDLATAQAGTRADLLVLRQRAPNHNGGAIAFGPLDGYLYIGFGDEGGSNDTFDNAQDVDTLHGAMLRIDVDNVPSGASYGIPADNPFAASAGCGDAGCPEIFAWGLRNPWRWSFDRATGELWLGDVGQGRWEEVDRIERGGNYGWPEREGAHAYCPRGGCAGSGLIDPVTEYGRALGFSVTGGFVYRGSAIPELQGRFLFADFGTGRIWGLRYDAQGDALPIDQLTLLENTNLNIASFGQGNDGELYVVHRHAGAGRIYRIVPASGNAIVNGPPALLSQSGCVDPADPAAPAPGLVPYALNAPFWSDGADKRRWMALPDGASIDVQADGDWRFPPGSVLMKEFRLGGRPVETRLFMHHDNGAWAGYSYAWRADGSDAELVAQGRSASIDGQVWRFPSAAECRRCHTAAAGRTLGPETAQLNRALRYPSSGLDAYQLSTLNAIGLFSAPLTGAPEQHPRLPDPGDPAAGPGARARAYLHVNCSGCHRPGGPTPVDIDLRYATPAGALNLCGFAPTRGDVGIIDPLRLAPGEPARSTLLARMDRRDAAGMPPLASSLVDAAGVALIGQWISGLGACP